MKAKENQSSATSIAEKKRRPLVDITNTYEPRPRLTRELVGSAAASRRYQTAQPRGTLSQIGHPQIDSSDNDENSAPTASRALPYTRPAFKQSTSTPSLTSDTDATRSSPKGKRRVSRANSVQAKAFDAVKFAQQLHARERVGNIGWPTPRPLLPDALADQITPPASCTVLPVNRESAFDPPEACRPTCFSAVHLPSKTHKTVHGQVVILPSYSVLVDFREGERRKGRRGDEVLVVSADGTKVCDSCPRVSHCRSVQLDQSTTDTSLWCTASKHTLLPCRSEC